MDSLCVSAGVAPAESRGLKQEGSQRGNAESPKVLFLPSRKERTVIQRMQKLQPPKDDVKRKAAFIIHNSPAWLDTHQNWISDGARRLYKALVTLADVKTGRLFIPGRGWIRIRTVQQKAGMSKNTRLRYMRELLALGAVRMHRDYVTRRIQGRNRKVLGQAQITVLPLCAPNPHKQRTSTTDQSCANAKIEPQYSVSTMDQSTTDQSKNGLLRTTFSTVQELVHQDLSETTSKAGAGSPPVGVSAPSVPALGLSAAATAPAALNTGLGDCPDNPVNNGRRGQGSPASKPAPNPIYFEKIEKLTSHLEEKFYDRASQEVLTKGGPQKPFADVWFWDIERDCLRYIVNEQGISMADFRKAYNGAMRKVELAVAEVQRPSNLDPRPIDPATLLECAEGDPDCRDCWIQNHGGVKIAVMIFDDGEQHFIEGELAPVWHSFYTP